MKTTTTTTTTTNAISAVVEQTVPKKTPRAKKATPVARALAITPLAKDLAKTVSTGATVETGADNAENESARRYLKNDIVSIMDAVSTANEKAAKAVGKDKSAVQLDCLSLGARLFGGIAGKQEKLSEWFAANRNTLTKVTQAGNIQLDTARVYQTIFAVEWDAQKNGALKSQPFYTELRNSLGYYARTNKLLPKKAKPEPTHDGIVTAIMQYLDSKEKGAALEAVRRWRVDNEPAIK